MSAIDVSEATISELLTRSVDTIYPKKDALKAALTSGKQLRIYVGIDPTADYVHLGHSTNYLILERLHKLGHKIIVLVGDFTAMVGDPSDKGAARVRLTRKDVEANLTSFKSQIGKILPFEDTKNPIEFKFNAEWLADLNFEDLTELASQFTVQQMIERDAFQKRLDEQKPLYVHEFFYPLMQGYDSVALEADLEIGGTDQTFNMLAGRTLVKRYQNRDKFVLTTKLLENPVTGEKLMSKSLGTGIGLNEEPDPMFGKAMRLPDEAILQCFVDCTRLSAKELEKMAERFAGGENPRDLKLEFATEIVTMYHDAKEAEKARDKWVSQFSEGNRPVDIPEEKLTKKSWDPIELLVGLKLAESNSAARRLIEQGGVRINDEKITKDEVKVKSGDVLQVGKRRFVKLKVQ